MLIGELTAIRKEFVSHKRLKIILKQIKIDR